MKITPDRLAVARAVQAEYLRSWVEPENRAAAATLALDSLIEPLPEPPDDSPATLPAPTGLLAAAQEWQAARGSLSVARSVHDGAHREISDGYARLHAAECAMDAAIAAAEDPLPAPPGIGVCCMCDAKIPVACKGCLDYARESVGLPAPDVQAQPSHLDVGVCGNLPSQTPREIWESHRVPAPVQAQEERPTHACDHAAGYCVGFRGEPCNEPDNDAARADEREAIIDAIGGLDGPADYRRAMWDVLRIIAARSGAKGE